MKYQKNKTGMIDRVRRSFLRMTSPFEFGGARRSGSLASINFPPEMAQRDAAYCCALKLLRVNLFSHSDEERRDIYSLAEALIGISLEKAERIYKAARNERRVLEYPEMIRFVTLVKSLLGTLGDLADYQYSIDHSVDGMAAFFGCDYAYRLYCVTIVEASGYREINGRQLWLNSMHATAAGRVILAARGEAYLERFLEQSELRKFNPQTKNMPEQLRAEVEKTRRDGFSVVEDEHVVGFISVAIPVTTPQGKLLGGLASSCRTHFWHERKLQLEEVLRDLRWSAGRIIEAHGNLL